MLDYITNGIGLFFFASEMILLFFKRSKSSEVKISKDKNSLRLLWIVITLSIVAAKSMENFIHYDHRMMNLVIAGMVIFSIGFIIRMLAIYQLGKEFTVDVAIAKEHQLNQSGLYKFIRHPSYLGLLLEFSGISFLFNSWVCIPIVIVPFLLALMYRIKIEEELLCEALGNPYREYMKKTKRIIPGIY